MPVSLNKDRHSKQLEVGKNFVLPRNKLQSVQDDIAVRRIDVSARLQQYRLENRLSVRELAEQASTDEGYMRRLLQAKSQAYGLFVGLKVVDPIFANLGLELPPLYTRAWVRVE